MSLVTLTADESHNGMRVDQLLVSQYPEVSRTRLQKLFDEESVTLLDEPIMKSHRVTTGEVFSFPHPDTLFKPMEAHAMDFDIIFEDKAFMAINKPVGMAVHPVSLDDPQTTIANGVLAYLGPKAAKIGPSDRPCIVHRLDKETSGILLIAKTQKAFDSLKAIFADRKIEKNYLAIVRDTIDLMAGSIVNPMGRSLRSPLRMCVYAEGDEGFERAREARTDWDLLLNDPVANVALVRCRLHTGRTHQARVHLAYIGHPVLGDETYGYRGTYTGRILLHAQEVTLPHPISGKMMTITAPIPKDFTNFKGLFPRKAK